MKGIDVKLYVDDTREAPEGWTLARTFEEAMRHIASGKVAHLSLDHDLGKADGETGYDILKMIERAMNQVGFKPPESIKLHTANPVGYHNMKLAVENIRKLEVKLGMRVPQKKDRKRKKKTP